MNKFFKRTSMLLMAAVCASGFFACGTGDDYTAADAEEIDTNAEGSLTVLLPIDTTEKNLFNALIEGFNEVYPNIEVTIKTSDSLVRTLANASAGEYDIVHCIGENVTSWADQEYIRSLDAYFELSNIDESLYYESMMALGKSQVDNEQYMIPRDYSRIICYYNKDVFDSLDIDYPTDTESNPWTWDRFMETCAAIKTAWANDGDSTNDAYIPCQASMGYDILNWAIAQSYGVTCVLDENYLPISSSDDQYSAWNSAFSLCRKMTREGYSRKSGAYLSTEFQNKQAAMALTTCVDSATYTSYGVNYDVLPFPAITANNDPKTPTGTSGYAMASTCRNENQAWALLKYIMSEAGEQIISENSLVPVMKSVAEDENAAWRSIKNGKGEDIDTDAFIKYPERDVIADWFGDLPAGAIAAYTEEYKYFLNQVCDNTDRLGAALNTFNASIVEIKEYNSYLF